MIDDPKLADMFRMESEERLAKLDSGLLRLDKTPEDPALLEELFRETHSLKGAARMLGLLAVETTAHGLESVLTAARKAETPLTAAGIESLEAGLKRLRVQIQEVVGSAPAPSAPVPAAAAAAGEAFQIETVRVETRRLDDLLALSDELGVLQGRSLHAQALMDGLLDQWSQIDVGRHRGGPPDADAIARLGALLEAAHSGMREDAARFESTLTGLQEHIHDMRLLPLSTVASQFPRMVKDIGKAQGKDIDFVVDGADIALDKRILEEIKDPLIHLLRNAIGHGIETPEERERLGKPRNGRIRLVASRSANRVSIAVEDDGHGLDLESIRRTAMSRGLYDAETLAAMSPAQLQQVVFMSGFSTLSQVTELAGRGVGLDVVRANVERLKGSIRIDSALGAGTRISLHLPLSLTAMHLLLVEAAGHRFGLPLNSIQTVRRLPAKSRYPLKGRMTVDVDGEPLLGPSLAELLELPAAAFAGETIDCIILQVENERVALQVGDVLAEEEVIPRPLGAPLRRVRNVAALATLASGEVCPVLNPADLLRSATLLAAQPAKAPASPAKAARPLILLVEDSALVRAMEKRIIEDAGYEVVTAIDGADALGKLGSRNFAGIVSDIEMPRLDGLSLTARIRQDPRYRGLPVILVTSLASDADKRRGLEAGANAYLPKPMFSQRILVDALKHLVGT